MLNVSWCVKRALARLMGRLAVTGTLLIPALASAVDMQVATLIDSPDPAVRGGNITYTITASNTEADTANNVVVTFALPADTQFVSVSDTAVPGACAHDGSSPGTVTCTYATLLGTLAVPTAGPVRTINVVLRTTGATVTTLNSTASITSSDIDANPGNNSLSQNTTINNGADLSATLVGAPDPATSGGIVTWTVSGSNLGPNNSGALTFSSTLPGVLTFVSGSGAGWACSAAGQVVTCTRAAVTVGTYPSLAIDTRVTGVSSGTITLSGNVSSTIGDPVLSNNSPVTSVAVNPGSDLAVTQDAPTPNPAPSGGTATFVLRPSNGGPNAATAGATVSFPLPADFGLNSATGSAGWTCTSAGTPVTVSCNFPGSLAPGATGTLTIVATVPTVTSNTTYPNITASIAPIAGGPPDPVAANNSAARSLSVLPDGADLSISKSKSPSFVALGANMTSIIVVANAGPRTAASGSITVVDVLDPTREQFVGFSGTNWACTSAPPNVNCTYNAALGVANSSALIITTRALSVGTAGNTATVAYSGTPGDVNPANNSISANVTVTAPNNSPDLQVGVSVATAGGTPNRVETSETQVTYTATLTNKVIATSAPAQNVVYALSIPGRLTTTSVAVTGQVLTNTSGSSNAVFTCTGTGSGSAGGVTCTQTAGTQLNPGDIVTFTVTANRPLSDGSFNVTAAASSTSQGDPLPSDNAATAPVIIDPIADVEVVSKVLAANPVLAGTSAAYTITLRNNGPSSAAGVTLTDVFAIPVGDSGFTFLTATASDSGSCSGLSANTSYTTGTPTLSCSWAAAVTNGATRTVTVVIRPNWQPGTAVRTLDNTATVATTTAEDSAGGQGTAVNSRSLTLNINPAQVDMLINNTDTPDPLGYDVGAPVNNDITYTVVTTNNGPSLASGTGFTYTMTPPVGKTISFRGDGSAADVAAVNPGGTIPGSLCDQLGSSVTGPASLTITCAYPAPAQLANGASLTRHIVFRVVTAPATGGDTYNTNASVIVNETDSNLSNNAEREATTIRVRADLAIVKTASLNPVQLHQPFDWSLVVTNAGPGDSQATGLTDTLPTGMVFGAGTPSWTLSSGGSGSCGVTGQTMSCAFGLVPAGQRVTVTIPGVRMTSFPTGGTTQNCATSTTSEVDPVSANNVNVCSTLTVQRSSLAGTVFQDRDRTGANAGTPQAIGSEPRIAGVTINLSGTDAYGNAVSQSATTDAAGAYSFTDLSPAGTDGYTLTQTQPAGFVNGPANPPVPAATGNYAAGGGSGNSGWSRIALAANTAGTGYDFPEVRRVSLSGFVYVDVNLNGTRDAGTDTPISGATVRLLDASTQAVLQSATTDATGAYSFSNLDPLVAYTLEQPLPSSPAGLGNGPINPGLINGAICAAGCAAQANTPAANTDRIAAIDLGAGFDGTLFNFGERQLTSISGLVFVDSNRDNSLGGGETGRIAGVTLRLVQGADCTSGTTLQTTTSAADGSYAFGNVVAGQNYLICQTQPSGYGSSGSNVITITGLPAGGSADNHFGETLASISGSVYADSSPAAPANTDNGLRDAGETGIAGVIITLTGNDITGAPVNRTTSTDPSGNYSFDGLLQSGPGGYTLSEGVIPPAAGSFNDGRDTVGTAGGSGAVNDALGAVVLGAGVQATGYNFGELPIAPITGTVYIDRDRDNTIDASPADGRLAGVPITLYVGSSCSGTPVGSTVSDASGNYSFSGVSVGVTYTVCQSQPAGYADGSVNPGNNGSSSAANAITISNLPPAGSAGNHFAERVGSIAGSVYLDANNDGTRQGGESGIAGVTLTLTGNDITGAPVNRTAVTDGSGNFLFADLLAAGPGGYTITEPSTQPAVGSVTTLNGRTTAGSIAAVSSGAATAVATIPSAISAIALPAGGDSIANHFGEILPVGLSGAVFIDLNNNGVQDAPADTGLTGVTIVITGTDDTGATVTRTLTTAADGRYAVADLRPGTYTVSEPNQPAGTSNGLTVPGSAGGTATAQTVTPSAIGSIVLTTPGAQSSGNNFTEIPNSSAIEGRVWLDADNNGSIDSAETGIAGVLIQLTGTDTAGQAVTRTASTDASGNYRFDNLAPGSYTIAEPTQPAGTLNGRTLAGSGGGTATAVNTVPSAIATIPLAVAQISTANHFGEVPAGQIGGRVYADNNNNGSIDGGETGLPNVTLVLSGTDDLGNPVNASVTTGPDGSYVFPNLRPGTYTVTQPTQPAGTVNGLTSPGPLGGSATPPATTPSAIAGIVLAPGANASGSNFGEIGSSPDLRVSKRHDGTVFTVGKTAIYRITVRNVGDIASRGVITVEDRLPTGLTLAATPTGPGWSCVGAVGATTFNCTTSSVVNPGTSLADVITAAANVGAAAAAASPANNVALVGGGGELDLRRPSAAERDAFSNNPASLPLCTPAIEHNVCRDAAPVQLAASMSGTVWSDIGNTPRVLDGADRRLPGWLVELVDVADSAVIARATTVADGSYRIADLVPGLEYAVRFRDPQSNVVFGYPVNGESAPGSSGVACAAGTPAAGSASSCVGTGASPQLTVVLAPGQELPQQSLPVDPSGVIYDSSLRQPVPGSVVTLAPTGTCAGWNPATSLVAATLGGYTVNGDAVSMTVGNDGFYQYLFTPSAPASCAFGLTVTPPAGYTAPSTAIPPTAGPLLPPGGPGSVFAVQPQAGAPTAPVGTGTTYYLTLTSGSAGANVVHNHIPLDPSLPVGLSLSKTGDKALAEVGDTVRYTIAVSLNSGPRPRQTTVVDRLPAGFTYVRGSASVNGTAIVDPIGGVGPTLAFNLGEMPVSNRLELRYRVRVGVGAQQGDGINRARAYACGVPTGCVGPTFDPLPISVPTNEGRFRVKVSGGVFTTDACVLGKVFVDCNGNHVQDREELGVPGVRLVLSDGTTLISDSEGKYSICGLPARSHVLKLDGTTLPRGSRLTTSSNRNLGDAGSLWLDLKNGELHRADFVEGSCSNSVLEQTKARRAQGEVRAPEVEKKGSPALRFDSKSPQLDTLRSPQQGTDGANQRAPKARTPVPGAAGASLDETNVPAPELPMNRPPPRGRDAGTAPDATASAPKGGSNGAR